MEDKRLEELERNISGLEMELLNVQAEITGLPAFVAEVRMRLEVIEKTLGIKPPRRGLDITH